MELKKCISCSGIFLPSPQVHNQTYCSKPECQRERRKRSHKKKLEVDSDYKENQKRAQKDWAKRNPDYWREYRKNNPKYNERNREKQKRRNRKKSVDTSVKMKSKTDITSGPSGTYLLRKIDETNIAKIDEWIVEIKLISRI